MLRRLMVGATIGIAALLVPGTAFANDCFNPSRAPARNLPDQPLFQEVDQEEGVIFTGWVEQGRWLYFTVSTLDGYQLLAAWGFEPPGGYQAGEGFALLDQYLAGHGKECETPNRQPGPNFDLSTLHGVTAGFCSLGE